MDVQGVLPKPSDSLRTIGGSPNRGKAMTDYEMFDVFSNHMSLVFNTFMGLGLEAECPLWVVSGHSEVRKMPDSRIWSLGCVRECLLSANSGHSDR